MPGVSVSRRPAAPGRGEWGCAGGGGAGGVRPRGLMPGVSVSRRPAAPGRDLGAAPPAAPSLVPGLAGPLKVLAAVAAPDETRTVNAPLDAEAEMAAVLDAGAPGASGPGGHGRIL